MRPSILHQAIRRAIERPVSTLIAASALVVLGTFSLFRLPVSLLPSVERPGLEITATAEGRSRDELLDRVTRPLERRLAALAGVTSVRTRTADGVVRAWVESEWQTDADRLRIEAERRLAGLGDVLLEVELTAGDPEPIVEVAVLGGGGAERTSFVRRLLVPELARLEGAGRIETVGLAPRHVVVRPRPAALAARGLTVGDLVARLESVGVALPAGRARSGAAVRPLLVREEVRSLESLAAVRVPGPRGESVLGDLAALSLEEVRDGSLFRLRSGEGMQEGALVRVFRAPEANAVALAGRVRERVGELAGRAGAGLRLEVVDDRSSEVLAALVDLGIAALAGLLLGTVAIRAFLGCWRPTLALAVVVPASVLATFTAFHLAGSSLDVVSLAGLALAAGMLVDSAVVVLEAIETARDQGLPEPAVTGTRQIAVPLIAGFLTTAVVFLPLIYLQGLARAFFGVQAFAIVATLAAALVFSLTVTPVLAGQAGPSAAGWSGGRRLYLRLLDASLARPALTVLCGIAVTALAGVALVLLPRELVPDAPSRELVVRYRLAPDLTPEAARRLGGRLAERVQAVAGEGVRIEVVQIPETGETEKAGDDGTDSRDGGRRQGEEETGRLVLAFAEAAAAERALPELRSAVSRLPGIEARVEPRTSAFVEPIEQAGRRLEVIALATTPERATALAGRATERLRAAGLRPAGARRDRPREALHLAWDLPRLARLGADRAALESQVRLALSEREAGRVRMEAVEPEIRVVPAAADPALLPLAVTENGAAPVTPLGALARLAPGVRPAELERQDGRPAVRLAFEGALSDPARAASLLDGLENGVEEELVPGGQALELARSFGQLRLALALSLLLVFLTLAAIYESFRLPLVVMSTVPVALGGALGLLLVTGQSLDVLSFLGLILLGGIVVNNAIVLVHRSEEHRQAGMERTEALRRAGSERYRPILMTTLTTLAGMLPLAVMGGEGAELRQSMATAVIGGMMTSTFASLLLVPVLQRAFTPRRTAG